MAYEFICFRNDGFYYMNWLESFLKLPSRVANSINTKLDQRALFPDPDNRDMKIKKKKKKRLESPLLLGFYSLTDYHV